MHNVNLISVTKYIQFMFSKNQLAIQLHAICISNVYNKLQFTFQISPFTKYGHHGSLMNYTTGMSKHTCKQCKQHFCHGLQLFHNHSNTFTIRQFTISSWLAMHDDVTGIKVFNKSQTTCHIIAIHISVRQITSQRIKANEQHNLLNPHHSNIKNTPQCLYIITVMFFSWNIFHTNHQIT